MSEELLNEFTKRFPIIKGNSNNPYIIVLDAYTGMGKSTVALKIAEYKWLWWQNKFKG